MKMKNVLAGLDIFPNKEELKKLKIATGDFVELLKSGLKKKRLDGDVFVGGSFSKGTVIKKSVYDIDIFVRFDWKYENISELMGRVLSDLAKKEKLDVKRMHGSRDYFNVVYKEVLFEIIPVAKIKNPRAARNVTDLSYFHVNYVKKKLGKKLGMEVGIAKAFCHAQNVYGAESYIQGFSGYALECLIIYYKGFEKMLKELIKIKEGERVVIDPAKHYKKKENIFIEINESKIRGPIVLVDPTWKERNVLGALSSETFRKFQSATREFLRRPGAGFFEKRKIDKCLLKKLARKKNAEFLVAEIKTDRQEGDIAGTKLKKFAGFLGGEIGKYFDILQKEFEYDEKKSGKVYFVLKKKREVIKIGPPLKMEEHVNAFKKENKKTFVKNGIIHARIKLNFSAKKFLESWKEKNKNKIKEMGIIKLLLI